jgi:putative peptide zinc metalloprotease protein
MPLSSVNAYNAMESEIINIVPKISAQIAFYPFDKQTYLVQQKSHAHQLRINKATYDLLSLVNGERTINDITAIYNQSLPIPISVKDVHNTLFEKLSEWGIIEDDKPIKIRQKDTYLMLRFTLLPVKFLNKITPKLGSLFNPAIFYLLGSIMILSACFLGRYMYLSNTKIDNQISSALLFQVYIISGISVLLHELGHVSACNKFGAKHGEIGFGFYLFMPVCYADVTDAWKLPASKRIIIDLAGVFMDLIFLHLCFLIFYFFQVQVMAYICIPIILNILFNLNPFFRFDGYWVLADALGIPNLRAKSMTYFQEIIFLVTKPSISPQSVFLFTYGALLWGLLILFLGTVLYYQSSSLWYFPVELLELSKTLIFSTQDITLRYLQGHISKILVPIIFYITVWNLCKKRVITVRDFLRQTIQ